MRPVWKLQILSRVEWIVVDEVREWAVCLLFCSYTSDALLEVLNNILNTPSRRMSVETQHGQYLRSKMNPGPWWFEVAAFAGALSTTIIGTQS